MSGETFILASSSPRRRQLLDQAGYRFRVIEPPLPEPAAPHLPPVEQAEALAYFKAAAVVERHRPELPVLGADTIVALGRRVFGKPRDAAHARQILQTLSGTRHRVITALALLAPDGRRWIEHETTCVSMRAMSERELREYLDSGAWEGKAGAYGIQDAGDAFVERLEGSFSNVVGLPVERVGRLLARLDNARPAPRERP